MSTIDPKRTSSMQIGGNFKIRFSGKLKASTQLVGKENIAEVEAEKPIERMIESVHQVSTRIKVTTHFHPKVAVCSHSQCTTML